MPNFLPGGYTDSEDSDDDFFIMSHTQKNRNIGQNHNTVRVVPEIPPLEKARHAVTSGDIDTIHKLLEDQKIEVDSDIDYYKWSMLMFAAKVLNPEIMQFLIEKGANPNFRGTDGYTPLLALAATEERPDDLKCSKCLSILLDAGADITLKDKIESTVLHVAAKNNNIYLAKRFLELGVPIDALDLSGRSAIHHVADCGYGLLNRLLIQQGCNVSIVDDEGLKPYEVAGNRGNDSISDILYKVESTNWMPGKDPQLLKVTHDIKPREQLEAFVVTQRDQIEMILGQIELPHLLPLFENHDINYFIFLRLNDSYLREMGISNSEERLKVMDSIRAANNLNWEKSSVASVYMQQAGITMPEVICVLGNLKNHMKFISKRLKFLHEAIQEDPNVLCIGGESATIREFCQEIVLSVNGLDRLGQEAREVKELVEQLAGLSEIQPSRTRNQKPRKSNKTWYLIFGCVVGIVCLSIKRPSIIVGLVKCKSVQ